MHLLRQARKCQDLKRKSLLLFVFIMPLFVSIDEFSVVMKYFALQMGNILMKDIYFYHILIKPLI